MNANTTSARTARQAFDTKNDWFEALYSTTHPADVVAKPKFFRTEVTTALDLVDIINNQH